MVDRNPTKKSNSFIVEDSTAFSRPLCLSKENNQLSLAHYTVSEWDIDYDPWMIINLDDWTPISIYRFHHGQLIVGKDLTLKEALKQLNEWAETLLSQNYHNPLFAQCNRCKL